MKQKFVSVLQGLAAGGEKNPAKKGEGTLGGLPTHWTKTRIPPEKSINLKKGTKRPKTKCSGVAGCAWEREGERITRDLKDMNAHVSGPYLRKLREVVPIRKGESYWTNSEGGPKRKRGESQL